MEDKVGPAATRWDRFVAVVLALTDRFRYPLAVFWLAVLVVSTVFGPKLLTSTSSQYDPPSHTQAADANAVLAREFPSIGQTSTLGVLIEIKNHSEVCALACLPLSAGR